MDAERAREILAAYGAEPTRWPPHERGKCLALIARDPTLVREREAAARLDRAIVAWARAPVTPGSAETHAAVTRALAALPQAAPAVQRPRWRARWPLVGGALAASAAALLMLRGHDPGSMSQHRPAALASASATTTDSDAFRAVFTPTPDEEDVL